MTTPKPIQSVFRFLSVSTVFFSVSTTGYLAAQGLLAPPPVGTIPFGDEAVDTLGAPKANMKSLTQTDPGQPLPSMNPALTDLNGSLGAYTITEAGHYYLTGNIVGDKPIVIAAHDVTLDLRGFEVRFKAGEGSPSIPAISAGPTASGPAERTHVRNGFIVGEWLAGVALSEYCSVRDLNVDGVETFAIAVARQSIVHNCIVHGRDLEGSDGSMGHAGIMAGEGSVVGNSTVREIWGDGIRVMATSRIADCVVTCNLGSGIVAGPATTIEGSSSFMNLVKGFDCGESVSIVNSSAAENFEDGFVVRAGSNLANCVSRANKGDGYLAMPMDPIDLVDPFANPRLTDNGSSFLHCSATRNLRDGFRTTVNTTYTHCTADRNGGGEAEDPLFGVNPGDGFDVVDSCRLVNCMASNNVLSGIRAIEDNFIEQNTCHTNGVMGIELASSANVVIKNYTKYNGSFNIAIAGAAGAGMGSVAPFVLPSAAAPNPFGNFAF